MNNFLNISNEIERKNNLEGMQKQFLESTLGKGINAAIDIGLKYVLPDLIENEIIDVKNALISGGLKEGINQAINSAINFGKSAIGIFTGNFENLTQAQTAIKKGGIIDNISNILDSVIKNINNSGKIPKDILNVVKNGKNIILDNISKNIENNFNIQMSDIDRLNSYEKNWKNYFEAKDFDGMVKEFNNIKEILNNILPIEQIINQARIIENIQSIIENNNGNFNLTKEQIELANMLI